MSDIFREVDEEVQRDKVAMFVKKHSNLLIGLLLAVVVGVGGYRVYDYFQKKQAAEAGVKYEAALSLSADGKDAESRSALEALTKDAPAGYKMLAQFRLASELAKTDKPAAIKAFEALSGEAAVDQTLRDLAKLRAAALLSDTVPFAEVQQRLEPLAAPGQTWRLSAREILAATALKAGDFKKTEQYLELMLADPEASRTVRERAEMMMSLVRGGALAK